MAKFDHPIHDLGDQWYRIQGTFYFQPGQDKTYECQAINDEGQLVPYKGEYCVCGWGDTTETYKTALGAFRFCRGRHGKDPEAFASEHIENMKIFEEFKNQLKLNL